MERIFESVNKAVIALIADVNNSKALVGNSLLQGSVVSARRRDNLTHVCMLSLSPHALFTCKNKRH